MSKKPFVPHELPIETLDWKKLLQPVGEASSAISRYDGLLHSMINPSILLAPLTTREAVLSSRIEGTQASLSEVLQHEAGAEYDEVKTQDIYEILNYRKALQAAEHELEKRPISLNFIKALHKILMDGVRGKDKQPGEFRIDQNWIGPHKCTLEQARFVPPNPMILPEHLDKWESYVQQDVEEALIKLSIIHAQFEILHPFMDGNGRMGRIIIPLYLFQRQLLHRPMFYLSEYLEAHRDAYYDKLLLITDRNDWQGWVEFFLQAIMQQANANTEKAKKIQQLHERLKDAFREATHSQYAIVALDTFFAKPIITASEFSSRSNIPTYATANTILRTLTKAGYLSIVREGSGRSPAVFMLPELLNITEGKKVFSVNTTVMP